MCTLARSCDNGVVCGQSNHLAVVRLATVERLQGAGQFTSISTICPGLAVRVSLCVSRWVSRYEVEGEDGLREQSSRPRTSPSRTDVARVPAGGSPPASAATTRVRSGSTTSTPWSMTTPDWPTPRCCPTRRALPARCPLDRAATYFAAHGITRIERVLTDNA
jgi:leucine-zipper of insertion element IS481